MVQLETSQLLGDSLLPTPKDVEAPEDFDMMDCSTDEASEAETGSRSSSLERTSSQAAAQMQIQGVTARLEERRALVQELKRSVSALSCEGQGGLQTPEVTEEFIDAARKKARHLGEDLLEDLLALDKLSGLITEDRNRRKAAIAGIDTLLEDVDASKALLANLHKQVQNEVEVVKNRQREAETEKAKSHVLDMEETVCPTQCSRGSATAARTSSRHRAAHEEQQLPAPNVAMWKNLIRPVDFQIRQERSYHALLAALPGLNTEDLEIELSDDQSTLTITGRCLPTTRQAEQMQKELLMQLQRLARSSPQRFRQLSSKLDQVALEAYTEIGEGKFGTFSETFRLPPDVDAQRIRASFEDGVLRITLPRRVLHEARPMTFQHPFGHQRSAGLWGHPSFGW